MSKIERVYLRGDFGLTGLYCKAHDVDQLEAINAELLEALEKIAALDYTKGGINCFCWRAHTIAEAAIAKAKGEQP